MTQMERDRGIENHGELADSHGGGKDDEAFDCSKCGKEIDELYFSPTGKILCYDCYVDFYPEDDPREDR